MEVVAPLTGWHRCVSLITLLHDAEVILLNQRLRLWLPHNASTACRTPRLGSPEDGTHRTKTTRSQTAGNHIEITIPADRIAVEEGVEVGGTNANSIAISTKYRRAVDQ
jgi:hypothetical protein